MSCNCIEKIDNQLKEFTGDDKASLNVLISFDGKPNKPYMEYKYREKKKDGTFKDNKKSGNMMPSYCPFCGKKYE